METGLMNQILEKGIIAIMRGVAPQDAEPTVEALLSGGISTLEVAFNHKSPEGMQQTLESMRRIQTGFGTAVQMGAGTVLSEEDVDMARECGATYMISPNVDPVVIRHTKACGCLSFPGALTPSEIALAASAGADAIKLFPAGNFGPNYLRAVMGPLGHLTYFAVGGITCDNMQQFLKAGVKGFGIGGNLVDLQAIRRGDFATITRTAREFVEAWRQFALK